MRQHLRILALTWPARRKLLADPGQLTLFSGGDATQQSTHPPSLAHVVISGPAPSAGLFFALLRQAAHVMSLFVNCCQQVMHVLFVYMLQLG